MMTNSAAEDVYFYMILEYNMELLQELQYFRCNYTREHYFLSNTTYFLQEQAPYSFLTSGNLVF